MNHKNSKFIEMWKLLQYFTLIALIVSFFISLLLNKNIFKNIYLQTDLQAILIPTGLFLLSFASIIGLKKRTSFGFYFNCTFILLVLIVLVHQLIYLFNFIEAIVTTFFVIFLIQMFKEKKYFTSK